jgi:hypothetical protein
MQEPPAWRENDLLGVSVKENWNLNPVPESKHRKLPTNLTQTAGSFTTHCSSGRHRKKALIHDASFLKRCFHILKRDETVTVITMEKHTANIYSERPSSNYKAEEFKVGLSCSIIVCGNKQNMAPSNF